MTALLSVRGLSAGYGAKTVLTGVSFDIEKGEFFTVVGPNGAGKSTLLKAIVGLVRVTAGEIHLEGRPIHGLPTEEMSRQGVALVPEGHQAFREMTVAENLEVGGTTLPVQAMRRALDRVYDLFPPLAARRRQNAGTLSGGELQMLAIGRALMMEPVLLMLDEPSLGLAPKFVQILFATLKRLREGGTTILLVEQKAREALALSDRGLVMHLGRVRLQGGARELLNGGALQEAYLGRRHARKSVRSDNAERESGVK